MEKPTKNIRYDKAAEALYIIDQTLLPGQEREIRLETLEQMYDAIKLLRVRGAPAIGICAAYCLYVLARGIETPDAAAFEQTLEKYAGELNGSRPTAVNLSWAIRVMLETAGLTGRSPGRRCWRHCIKRRWRSSRRTSPCAGPFPNTG